MLKKTIMAALMALTLPAGMAVADGVADAAQRASSACLVAAAWNEARGRPTEEVVAVMHAVVNRSNHPAFESTVCGVVLEKGQFHMAPDFRRLVVEAKRTGHVRLKLSRPADVSTYERMAVLADLVLDGNSADPTHGATHFYTPKLRALMRLPKAPAWAKRLQFTAAIGEFRFHKQKAL